MKLFFSKSDLQTYVGFNDRWAALLGIFPLAELGNILFIGSQPEMGFWDSFACYGIALVMTIIYWTISRYWVIRLRMWMPEREHTAKRIGITLGVLAFVVVLISAVAQPIIDQINPPIGMDSPSVFYKSVMSYTLVLMVMAGYEGAYFFVKYKESLLEQERLAKENMQAQLSVLKQQMNPHFLFNSLNTLVNIIPEDAEKATLFTQRLAAVYRRILEYRHKELIPLTEELAALQDYIFLMQTRFEDKLCVQFCVPDSGAQTQVICEDKIAVINAPPFLRHHRIVPLSIQILVENAIKHNVISSEHPLTIKIQLAYDSITVSNRLRLRERKLSSTGWGHENLKERYRTITEEKVIIDQTADVYSVSIPILSTRVAHKVATA